LLGSQGNPGVLRRSIREIFRVAQQRKTEGESSYSFHVSALLITSDAAIDLLVDRRKKTSPSPDVRHDARGSSHVHVSAVEVRNWNSAFQQLLLIESTGSLRVWGA
jgi:hypothetical protein